MAVRHGILRTGVKMGATEMGEGKREGREREAHLPRCLTVSSRGEKPRTGWVSMEVGAKTEL